MLLECWSKQWPTSNKVKVIRRESKLPNSFSVFMLDLIMSKNWKKSVLEKLNLKKSLF